MKNYSRMKKPQCLFLHTSLTIRRQKLTASRKGSSENLRAVMNRGISRVENRERSRWMINSMITSPAEFVLFPPPHLLDLLLRLFLLPLSFSTTLIYLNESFYRFCQHILKKKKKIINKKGKQWIWRMATATGILPCVWKNLEELYRCEINAILSKLSCDFPCLFSLTYYNIT